MGIALEWSSIRREVEDHAQLVLRLTPLPLGRSEVDLQRRQWRFETTTAIGGASGLHTGPRSEPSLGCRGATGNGRLGGHMRHVPRLLEVPSPEPMTVLEPRRT